MYLLDIRHTGVLEALPSVYSENFLPYSPKTDRSKFFCADPATFFAIQVNLAVSVTLVLRSSSRLPSAKVLMLGSREGFIKRPSFSQVILGGGMPATGQSMTRGRDTITDKFPGEAAKSSILGGTGKSKICHTFNMVNGNKTS